MLGDDALGGGVPAAVGELIQPLGELDVQVIEIAEAAGQEEVLAHIAEGPFDFALGLGAVRLAGLRQETVVAGQGEELGIVGDALGRLIGVFDLAQHGHAVGDKALGPDAVAEIGGDGVGHLRQPGLQCAAQAPEVVASLRMIGFGGLPGLAQAGQGRGEVGDGRVHASAV